MTGTSHRHPNAIRVFLSSPFADLAAERQYLADHIGPIFNQECEARGLTFELVDLRWGIPEDAQAKEKVVAACLAEIDRCRPYFIGILGDRYGTRWVRSPSPHGRDSPPLSITELEMQYAVFDCGSESMQAWFYLRTPRGAVEAEVQRLRDRIRASGFAVREGWSAPEALGALVLADLRSLIATLAPIVPVSGGEREWWLHEARVATCAAKRVGFADVEQRISDYAVADGPPLVLRGPPGSGKTTLLCAWTISFRQKNPDAVVLTYLVGTTPRSGETGRVLRTLVYGLRHSLGLSLEVPGRDASKDALWGAFHDALAAVPRTERVVLVIDGLDQAEATLGEQIPIVAGSLGHVKLVISTSTAFGNRLAEPNGWTGIDLRSLTREEAGQMARDRLSRAGKREDPLFPYLDRPIMRSPDALDRILNLAFQYGQHGAVDDFVDDLSEARSPRNLYNRVLDRYERSYGAGGAGWVRRCFRLLWAARDGLSPAELKALVVRELDVPGEEWAPFSVALDEDLNTASGLVTLPERARSVIAKKWLHDAEARRAAHTVLADYFRSRGTSARQVRELPFHLDRSGRVDELVTFIQDPRNLDAMAAESPFDLSRWLGRLEEAGRRAAEVLRPLLQDASGLDVGRLRYLSEALLRLGDVEHGYPLLDRLEAACRRDGDVRGVGETMARRVALLRRLGRHDQAELAQRALEEFDGGSGHGPSEATALVQRGIAARTAGRLDQALRLHERAAELSIASGQTEVVRAALEGAGITLFMMGRLPASLDKIQAARRVCEASGDTWGLQEVIGNEAIVTSALGNHEIAFLQLEQAQRIARDACLWLDLRRHLVNELKLHQKLSNAEGEREVLDRLRELPLGSSDPPRS